MTVSSDIFGEPAAVVLLCGLIAFLVSYTLLVEVAEFRRERTLLAGTIIAVTVVLIAAALAKPAISHWASSIDRARHTQPLADELKRY